MIHPTELQKARKAVRKFLILADDDPVDLVLFAGILANFAPDRDVPVWMIIVGHPASGKTDLISLIQNWRPVWVIPNELSQAYFFSAKTAQQSALERIKNGDYRILYYEDMGALMDIARLYSGSIYQQFRGIHDGLLKKETGYDSRPLVYGVEEPLQPGETEKRVTALPPAQRLGWIGSGTPEFYRWQQRHTLLGARFTCYYWSPLEDWTDYRKLSEFQELRSTRAHWRDHARTQVQSFLELCIKDMDNFAVTSISKPMTDQLGAVVKLVQRVSGTRRVSDTGARLHARIVAIVRMIAFMSGRSEVNEQDLAVGHKLALSQLPREHNEIVRFALDQFSKAKKGSTGTDAEADTGTDAEPPAPGRWTARALLLAIGGTRRVFEPILEDLVDVGVLDRIQNGRTPEFEFSREARKLARAFLRPPAR
jgi:hypothetical protein